MNRLYYKEPYLKEFVANIEGIIEKENKFHVVLDKTAFFPGGGGQFSDRGYINDKRVVDVYECNEIIYHVLEDDIREGYKEVKCKIDWERRIDGMQQHLGQHVLSGCFFKEFNQNTISFHMGKYSSTVDIKGEVDENKAWYIEKLANEIICKNLNVIFFIPSKEELQNIKLRRDIPITYKDISVLEIEGLDTNACCGLHPRKTLELQLIKIISWKRNKGCTRIEFLVGKRALDYILKLGKMNQSICDELTCGEENLLSTIKNIKLKNNYLLEENKKVKNTLNKYVKNKLLNSANKIKDVSVLSIIYLEGKIIIDNKEIEYNGDIKDIISVLNEIINEANIVILLASKQLGKSNLVFMKSESLDCIDMNLLFKKSIEVIGGKGGGNNNLMQGSGKDEKIEEALEVAKKHLNLIINNI